LQVELKGGRIDWRAIVESRSGRGEERIVTCTLQIFTVQIESYNIVES
jgi:hypothetical protein